MSCARVQTAIRAINQTCQLDRRKEPLYRSPEKYLKPLEMIFSGFTREEDALVPELAVPVGVPNQCVAVGQCSAATAKDAAIGDLVIIAFYYLLRVGEYTQKCKKNHDANDTVSAERYFIQEWQCTHPCGCTCIRSNEGNCSNPTTRQPKKWDKGIVDPSECNAWQVLPCQSINLSVSTFTGKQCKKG